MAHACRALRLPPSEVKALTLREVEAFSIVLEKEQQAQEQAERRQELKRKRG